ncbi:MAG: hypothetical protein DWH99_10720 [Planctomycetota bacterium]|nr:MAG: hypothetical protein DWH99_10720 [Planctomycetota bacterium]
MSFSFPSSVVAGRIGRNESPAPWQSSKRIERLQIEDEPKEIIPGGGLFYRSRGLGLWCCELFLRRFGRWRFLGSCWHPVRLLVLVLVLVLVLEPRQSCSIETGFKPP